MKALAQRSVAAGLRRPLGRDFYARPTDGLARAVLGKWLLSDTAAGLTGGPIVEAEAYGGPEDLASHARAGRTSRTAPMFGPPGHAYVYLVYGIHECLNVVAEREGQAGAVLLRAIEPRVGVELIRQRRGRPADPDHRLAAGPARLAQALAVDRTLDGLDLTVGRRLWLADPAAQAEDSAARTPAVVESGPRIGVGHAGAAWSAVPWRFWLSGHRSVSRR